MDSTTLGVLGNIGRHLCPTVASLSGKLDKVVLLAPGTPPFSVELEKEKRFFATLIVFMPSQYLRETYKERERESARERGRCTDLCSLFFTRAILLDGNEI
jgi:hypothetical protein